MPCLQFELNNCSKFLTQMDMGQGKASVWINIQIISSEYEFLIYVILFNPTPVPPPLPQGLVKGAKLCFRYPNFYFRHGERISTASQLISPASQKSKDLNKVSLLLQDL